MLGSVFAFIVYKMQQTIQHSSNTPNLDLTRWQHMGKYSRLELEYLYILDLVQVAIPPDLIRITGFELTHVNSTT